MFSKYKQGLIGVFVLFLILAIVYFWQLFAIKDVDRRYLTNDFNHYYNLINFVRSEESFPWWTPNRFQGLPLYAQMDLGLAYPPLLLLLLVSKLLSVNSDQFFKLLEFYTISHVAIAGVGVYLFTKKLNFSFYASILSSVAFMFSGIVIENMNAFPLHVSFVWFPMVFAYYVDFLKTKNRKAFLTCILIMAISLLGGILQVSIVYTFMLLFLYFTFHFFSREKLEGPVKNKKEVRNSLLLTFAIPIFAVLICSFQVLPAYELMGLSNRSSLNYEHTAWTGHFKPRNIIDFFILAPNLFYNRLSKFALKTNLCK